MVRHGQASFGMPNYDKLSLNGEKQSQALADLWASQAIKFDAIYSGSMQRHKQTVIPLIQTCGGNGLIPDKFDVIKDFDEFDAATVWKNQIELMVKEDPETAKDIAAIYDDRKAFERLFQKVMLRWAENEIDPAIKPSWKEFTARVRRGLKNMMSKHAKTQQIVVFTSAGPISAAIQMALDLSDIKTMEFSFTTLNASVTTFKYSGDRLGLMGFNNVCHLDKSMLTER